MTKINALKTIVGVGAAAFVTSSASAATVYSNVDNYLGVYTEFIGNGELGDQVNLAGTDRTLTSFALDYFLTTGGSAQAQVFLRSMDGPSSSPGTVLYDSGLVTLTAGFGHIEATGLSLDVPDTFTWSVAFSGLDTAGGERAGLLYYDPPTVGSSFDDFWQMTGTGWQLMDTPNLQDNFGAVFAAVPEPSTWALMLGGMGVLGFLSFRRKS